MQILDAMNQDSGIPLTQLQVDGGMTSNRLLMQLQADILCIPVGEASVHSYRISSGVFSGSNGISRRPKGNWFFNHQVTVMSSTKQYTLAAQTDWMIRGGEVVFFLHKTKIWKRYCPLVVSCGINDKTPEN